MLSTNSPTSPQSPFSAVCWGEKSSATTSTTPRSPASDVTDKLRSRKDGKVSRRRIVRACMRCRIRKTKCDGGKPCTRCTEADDVCEYMKCSKKESKEYSQDYVDRLLEQNDKYKTAMRVLYANRRLSIQPDSMVVPSTESDDIPLVHDILDRLGLLDQEQDRASQASETAVERLPIARNKAIQNLWSTASIQSSLFDTSIFDTRSSVTTESPSFNDLPALPELESSEAEMLSMDADMGLNFPFQVYESMNTSKTAEMFAQFTPEYFMPQQMSPQDVCPLNVLHNVMHGGMGADQSWTEADLTFQFSY
ncbi:hypothetical protein B0O99DRAFT_688038 [Bisporella sp. PMI_857]|nr:hypothetical protein B0O99DRAFT_688038 [Bisporella sp. PMI_857]